MLAVTKTFPVMMSLGSVIYITSANCFLDAQQNRKADYK